MGKTQRKILSNLFTKKHPHGRGEDWHYRKQTIQRLETPPRAWGRQHKDLGKIEDRRNTPTGVGKTISSSASWAVLGKHPHGRGEDLAAVGKIKEYMETPPRAWGRLFIRYRFSFSHGNTPTGVGKTQTWHGFLFVKRKHPHGRGEDYLPANYLTRHVETPPRAWGRHQQNVVRNYLTTRYGVLDILVFCIALLFKHQLQSGDFNNTSLGIANAADFVPWRVIDSTKHH